MTALGFTDQQLAHITRIAARLSQADRAAFLDLIASHVGPEPSNADIDAAIQRLTGAHHEQDNSN